MSYTYHGDISGTLDENIDIYTLENLGIELIEYYKYTCGCKTTLNEPSECDCEIEGENIQEETPCTIEFNIYEEDIETLKEALNEILLGFGEDKESFFNLMINLEEQSSFIFTEEKMNTYKELYALYKFGNNLYTYLIDTNICTFYFDM